MRTVRQDACVDEALATALEKWARAEEILEIAIWTIARDPAVGTPLTESGHNRILIIAGAESAGLPTLTIQYTYDDEVVTVYEALFEKSKYRHEGRA